MVQRSSALLVLTLILASCGGPPPEPPPPPPLNPVGTYNVSIDAQGQMVGGTLTIRESGERYAGYIDTDMGGAAVADVLVEGQTMTFSVPEAGVAFEVTFDGDEFSGSFDGAMGYGTITGVRRPSR